MDELLEFLRSPEWADIRRAMKGEDQRVGKKEIEAMLLEPFLAARAYVVGETLVDEHAFSERPDFICSREDGSLVGVETFRTDHRPRGTDHRAGRRDGAAPDRKEGGVSEKPRLTILVLATVRRSIQEMLWLLDDSIQSDFGHHGFIEVWFADFTGYEAYGTIELFALYPLGWWGHHQRPNAGAKPYG